MTHQYATGFTDSYEIIVEKYAQILPSTYDGLLRCHLHNPSGIVDPSGYSSEYQSVMFLSKSGMLRRPDLHSNAEVGENGATR